MDGNCSFSSLALQLNRRSPNAGREVRGEIMEYFPYGVFCIFEPPSGELRNNVRCFSWAHWKARSGLPISVN